MARRFTVQVRVSEEERAELRRRAGESSVSDYLRMVGLGGVVVKGEREKARSFPPAVRDRVDRSVASGLAMQEDSRGFRCPLPACRHQQKQAGKCPRHGHDLVPVRL